MCIVNYRIFHFSIYNIHALQNSNFNTFKEDAVNNCTLKFVRR